MLTVTNIGNGPTTGTITMQDNLPSGLTLTSASGTDWSCNNAQLVTCTRGVPLAPGASSVITLAANIAPSMPAGVANTAGVQTFGDSNSNNNSGSATITVTAVAPELTITKVAQGAPFQQGGTVSYAITVTNGGNGSTTGTITVQDIIPTGLTVTSAAGANWACSTGATVTCSRGVAIAAGATSVITLNANIASNAPASITNTVNVSGGGDSNTGNNAGSSVITVTQLAPELTITKVAQGGPFQQSGTVTYLLTVTNNGNGNTTGTITVTDIIPTGLTVTSATGANWSCSGTSTISCTRSSPIAPSTSSVITLNANIASNAPASITNTVNVSGGGDSNTGNNASSSLINVGPGLVTATINVPAGISYTFNGQTVTGSQTFNVAPGTYTLSTTTPQSLGAGIRAVFSSWSDAGAISHSITVGSSPLTITGNFTTQFQLTTAAAPSNGGAVTPVSDTFFDSGTVVNVSATPNSGFNFSNWTGAVANANSAATTVTMSAARSITANFTAQTGVTINVPAGISYTFNGQTVTGSQTFNIAPGIYNLSTTSPQALGAGTRAVFASWSNGQPISHSVTVGSSPITITGNFTTQFQLTTAASPSNGGAVTPVSGTFFDSGTVVNVTATPNSGFNFSTWTGPVANANSAATTVTMDAAKSITANFTAQIGVTINVPAGISYTFNGQTVTGSQTFNVAPGTYNLSTTTPQVLGAGARAVFASWSDAGAIAHSITVASSPLTITGNFITQFQLTTAASPSNGGAVTPVSGTFFDAGTVVNVSATANSGFNFSNWTGPVANANSAATTVTMDAAKSITANFTAQIGVTINVPAGISYTFNGQTVTGSQTFNVAPGTYNLSTTTPQSLGAGARAVFASWSNAGAISHNITVASSPITITGSFTTQFQLITSASSGGTVTPASGSFYDSGTVVNVAATANSGFTFSNWAGPVANPASAATTVTMDAAKSISANFNVVLTTPDITAQMTIVRGVAGFNRTTGRFVQTIRLTNNGPAVSAAAYVLDSLAAGFSVFNPDGITSTTLPAGSPFREIGPIASGATLTFTVELTRVGTPALTYTPRVLGPGSR